MHIQTIEDESRPQVSANFFRLFVEYANRYNQREVWTWGKHDSDVLAINEHDLREEFEIPWKKLNLIFAENCQQIYEYAFKLDQTKAYIFVTESWISKEELGIKFHGIPIVKHFCILNEILNYGRELYSPESHLSFIASTTEDPEFDFFCLVGRQSSLRARFISRLATIDLSNSLVKYNGKAMPGSGAYDHDSFSYNVNSIGGNYYRIETGMTSLPKYIQSKLYSKFKFEVQFETDACGGQGWDVTEYHVTEKTLKPLIMGKPCLMFGPVDYMSWLASWGIDLGHRNFQYNYDNITDDKQRVDEMVAYLKTLDFDKIVPNTEQHQSNMHGFYRLGQLSQRNCAELYQLIENF